MEAAGASFGRGAGPLRLDGSLRVLAPVELVRDHLLGRSLFQADALGFPFAPDGYERVIVQGELVTLEGRVELGGRTRLLSATLSVEEPCRVALRGLLHDTVEEPRSSRERYLRRFGRVLFELRGQPDMMGTQVSYRFELWPLCRLLGRARARLEEEVRARIEATTVRGLGELKGQLERELTAPHPKPWERPGPPG